MILAWIAKILAAVNSNRRPGEIAGGIAFACLLTLLPGGNLLWISIFFIMFFIKINFAMLLVFMAILSLIPPAADPLLNRIGMGILTLPALGTFFTSLYNTPFIPFTRFNDTLVMGGLAAGILLWPVFFILFRSLVVLYRSRLRGKIADSRPVKWFQKFPKVRKFLNLYKKAALLYADLA